MMCSILDLHTHISTFGWFFSFGFLADTDTEIEWWQHRFLSQAKFSHWLIWPGYLLVWVCFIGWLPLSIWPLLLFFWWSWDKTTFEWLWITRIFISLDIEFHRLLGFQACTSCHDRFIRNESFTQFFFPLWQIHISSTNCLDICIKVLAIPPSTSKRFGKQTNSISFLINAERCSLLGAFCSMYVIHVCLYHIHRQLPCIINQITIDRLNRSELPS